MNPSATAHPRTIPAVVKEIVFDQALIAARVAELADQISQDYRGRELVIAGVLKGAFIFASDLVRGIRVPVTSDFIAISRYRRTPGTRRVKILKDLEVDIANRDVLLVEDIVDTGLTMHYLIRILKQRRPASIQICTLLERPELRLVDVPIRYAGFQVNHEFLIGYGLDYREYYRDLPFIASMRLPDSDAVT